MMVEDCELVIADDDEDDFGFLSDALNEIHSSLKIQHVINGEHLLTYLSNLHTEKKSLPLLILLDINMPVKDGMEALKELKDSSLFASIPVIMYSTSSDREQERQSYGMGAQAFVTKASNFSETLKFAKYVSELIDDKRNN